MSNIKEQLLIETFENEFNLQRYKTFVNEFFNGPKLLNDKRMIGIWREYTNHIEAYYTIAKYTDKHNNYLLVLAVELERDSSVDKARSMQRNFISKILDDYNLESAIVAFYTEGNPSWRLSYVRLDYTFGESGLELELTPARRYSYLVGVNEPNHTALKQLYPIFAEDIKSPTIDEIEDAFSVERVTKDFFEQYKEKYLELKEYLETDQDFIEETKNLGLKLEKFSEQFAKKLLGQLVFLYFIQKKGWLGVRIVPKRISESEFLEIKDRTNKYQLDLLEEVYLFENNAYNLNLDKITNSLLTDHQYGMLSDIFKDTRFAEKWGEGYQSFIRDVLWTHCEQNERNFFIDYLEPFFYDALNKKRKNHYSNVFNCRIPFLNGGLFEPIESYNWRDTKFNIPNELFSNKTEKGKNANGILDIFDRFNFTMNEAEPFEKDVAVDPEMLGKIFEELLEVSDRKSKGAFYTPREIVHYMCQESLCDYLTNEVNIPREDIEEFILFGDLIKDADNRLKVVNEKEYTIKKSILANIIEIDNALKNIKIADPAVGSGAFPLGMLNEIVRLRNIITYYIVKMDNNNYGEKFIRQRRSTYQIKWNTIKNSIFAVDIEPSAVDITKLRLWLSVVVDQEINDDTPEPHVLPNLDMNIHVGDSLVDSYKGISLFDNKFSTSVTKKLKKTEQKSLFFDTFEIAEALREKQKQYFGETNSSNRKKIKEDIDLLRDDLIVESLNEKGKISEANEYRNNKNDGILPFFIWELEFMEVFKENKGFDIVIGNPPYVDSEEMSRTHKELREYCRKNYKTAKGNWDLFVIFIEKGTRLLNENGILSFIVPNKVIGARYTEALRKELSKFSINSIRDYSDMEVFDSAFVFPVVLNIEKTNVKKPVNIEIMSDISSIKSSLKIEPELFYKDINWDKFVTSDLTSIKIIEKMLVGKDLSNYATVRGAATVDEAYKVKEKIYDSMSNDVNIESFKFINTGTIDRFESLWGKQGTRYIKDTYEYPVILKEDLDNINNIRYQESLKDKIIIGGMNKHLECYLDKGEFLAGKSTTIIYDFQIDSSYLLGLLNSKLMTYFYRNNFKTLSLTGGYVRIGPPQINVLPIIINDDYKEELINYVGKIDNALINDEKIDIYEKQLNNLVYKIYGINNNEISIIEKYLENEGVY